MKSLIEIYKNHNGRPITQEKAVYAPFYERHFHRFRNSPIIMFEIGVYNGGSLQLWKEYFGKEAVIVGLDINPSTQFEESQIHVRIGDQSDPYFLEDVLKEFGSPNIVLDDGSHNQKDVLFSLQFLYPKIQDNGVYFIEDANTSYLQEYGGGLLKEGSLIEESKKLIDQVNVKDKWSTRYNLNKNENAILGMSFYNSIVVFEKAI